MVQFMFVPINKKTLAIKVGFFFGLFGVLSAMAIAKYIALHSTIADLGFFLSNFTKIYLGQWSNLFFVHFQPLLQFGALFHEIFPGEMIAPLLLFTQAGALAWPVVGLYRHFGVIPAVAFALYFPLWYNALFDFHMDHLAVPLLFGFFFLEKKGRIGWAVIMALLLALVKEPFALQTAACGVYLVFVRRHSFAGIVLIVFGLSYFYLATHYLIPYFTPESKIGLDSSAFSWLGHSLTDKIGFIVTKPHIVLGEIITDSGKIRYLFYIFGALAFIPLLRPGILIVALPVMAIALLSRTENYSGLFYHYTAGLIPPLIMAFAEGLPTARKFWSRLNFQKALFVPLLLGYLLLVHIRMAPSPMSYVFWNKDSWAYSYQAYIPTQRDKMIKEAIRLHVPSDLEVAVSVQNTVNWGYLANRKYYFAFPYGVLQPLKVLEGSNPNLGGLWHFIKTGEMSMARTEKIWGDYVVLDLKRPWFIEDKGCHWKNGKCIENDEFSFRFLALVQQTREHFDTVFEKDDFYILKRNNL